MELMPMPKLSESTLNAINTLGQWLAQTDMASPADASAAQLVVLAGNAALPTLETAAQISNAHALPLLITGGIGHSTTFLYAAVARHPRYNSLRTTGLSEADLLASIARKYLKVPEERLIIERRSTNSGENASFTRQLMEDKGLKPQRAVLIQDPTMQRRTAATFARVWRDAPAKPQWLSFPGFVPRVMNGERNLTFANPQDGLWEVARYLSLVLGEMPRLNDDEQGYGPRGRGFIEHVDMPADVHEAWEQVQNDAALTGPLRSRSLI
ncbi:YdcF family protein [Franconibacter sp. IITDAS19]|uniref:YdcF family protein n=1 Tax=Franconibacter sp. IITDAS19 TaxID=2930569 RepID=UPI001FFB6F24|nr:YdcF family protein [Franconibacter sp. IITDAS19]MCK1968275.1 YdcF family protein [Franconibacter sp. IITDAS19]